MTRDITFRDKQNDVGHANVKIDYKSIRVTVPTSIAGPPSAVASASRASST